jgi:aspartate racemase
MKKIGLIGGIGPESTLDYYERIIAAFRDDVAESGYPEIILYSANLTELMAILRAGDMAKLSGWLVGKIAALHRAGADFAAIGSNTPHIVFEEVAARSPIPLLSIVEATCQKAAGLGLQRLGLMGTRFTMQSDFYPRAFAARGMSVVVPDAESQQLIQQRLFAEIELGILKDSTRQELLAIAERMVDRDGIEGLILGCTELPLILDQDAYSGIPFLNTTAIHVESIVEYCRRPVHGGQGGAGATRAADLAGERGQDS